MGLIPFLHSIQVGQPKLMDGWSSGNGHPFFSAIGKEPIAGRVWLSTNGLAGDAVADRQHHGGPDKAVLVYSARHREFWEQELGRDATRPGAFGENFYVLNISEEDVCLGDCFQVGQAVLQISQPRQPCWKLARRWQHKGLALMVQRSGCTGWYMRTLAEGYVQAGDRFELIERPNAGWTVRRVSEIRHAQADDAVLLAARELAACPGLAPSWRLALQRKANGDVLADEEIRLFGPRSHHGQADG